jgi:hypothetical protein
MRLLRIFLTVLGAMLLIWTCFDYVPVMLQVAGQSATGRIISKSIERQGSAEETDGFYAIHYEFEAAGARQTGKATVPHKVYDSVQEGAPVKIRYMAKWPGLSLPDGYLGQGVRGLALLIAGAVMFVVGFFFIKPTY